MSALDRFRRRGAGPGSPLLALTLLGQIAVLVRIATLPPPPVPAPVPLSLSAAAVVEPGDGGAPLALARVGTTVDGARLQISFEADHDAYVSVLWFEGDRVTSLYPSTQRGESGQVAAGTTYVVPGASTYLRLTPTGPRGDWLAIVAGAAPDPEIEATLLDPTPDRVRALRAALMDSERARTSGGGGTERFLPTADGRAVPVTWERVRGFGRLVFGRTVVVQGGQTAML